MALTSEGLSQLKEYASEMRANAEGTATSPGGENWEATFQDNFDTVTGSPDYATWVAGTQYGKDYEENLQALKAIGEKARVQYLEAISKLDAYIAAQESINAGGGK